MPPFVAKDSHDGVVCQDGVADIGLRQPRFLGSGAQYLAAIISVVAKKEIKFWNRKL
jgi:hypothetical protein